MRRFRRPALLLLLVLGAALVGLAASEARRDTTPPQLYWEPPPARAEAGSTVGVFVSADEPVTYTLDYGDVHLSEVSQDLRTSVTVAAGTRSISVEAKDGSGNATRSEAVLVGVPPPLPEIATVDEVTAGDPMGVRIAWPAGSAVVSDVSVGFGQQLARVVRVDGGAKAIVPVSLDSASGAHDLSVSVTDEFGVVHTVHRSVMVHEFPEPVELIHLTPAVAALSTPAAKELEATTLDRVFAATPPQPAWYLPFEMPIAGVTSSGFGSPRRYYGGGPVSYHEGLDLAAPAGTPIHATNDGTVVVAGPYPIKGNLVVLDHGDGVFSLYFHQSKVLVHVGDAVSRGDVIGLVGTTGLSTGPHLHWEMRVAGQPTNPLAWVGKTFP